MTGQAALPTSVSDWVDYIQTLHHREMELTLDRVSAVNRRLFPQGVSFQLLTIAGTNGKGSTAEIISSIYAAGGYRVGKFTSPHIRKFNERFRINQQDVDDASLLDALAKIERSRDEIKLTFFEYGVLLASVLFEEADVEVAVMEVGLGGRLDAVNILHADCAVVTNISIDHVAWLGNTVEEIGREKIAIARSGRPCVIGMQQPPNSIINYCIENDINPLLLGQDFKCSLSEEGDGWNWESAATALHKLPLPFAQSGHQLNNAAVAVQAIFSLHAQLPINIEAITAGLEQAKLAGRCQLLSDNPKIVLDVSHNVASVAVLRDFVQSLECKGKVYAVCGMLEDKQIGESLVQLSELIDSWFVASLDNPRGASATQVIDEIQAQPSNEQTIQASKYTSVVDAYRAAQKMLTSDDCLLVFGSFFVVSDIIQLLENERL